MAAIIKKIKKGHAYYYAVESKRIDGKPRIAWQKYLGTIDAIMARAEQAAAPEPKEVVIFEAGGVAALARIAQRLGLVDIIDAVVPKRAQGPSVGQYLLLAAINRALAPCSKVAMGPWYERTVLRRLWGFEADAFSSQRFWDHMDRVTADDIETIQDRVLTAIKDNFGLGAETLLYDTTNFYTHINTLNERCELAQRGRNKQQRNDLRQYGLALLLSREFQIPLLHHVYQGNLADATVFAQLSRELLARYERATGRPCDATLVFDRGGASDESLAMLAVASTPFIAAMPATFRPQLLATPLEKFDPVASLPGTQTFGQSEVIWAKQCRTVVTYTESFFTRQLHAITQGMAKTQNKLQDLAKSLRVWSQGKGKGKRPTTAGVRKSVKRITSGQFIKDLFNVQVTEDRKTHLPQLAYHIDHAAFARLTAERLGRAVFVSTREKWSDAKIAETYRSLTDIEDIFRDIKNVDYLRWQPAHHWTSSKLRVHGLYCALALLLACLARKIAAQARVELPLLTLLDELTAIREVAVFYPPNTLGGRKEHITLSRMTPRQKRLAEAFDIANVLAGKG
jgi:transposase